METLIATSGVVSSAAPSEAPGFFSLGFSSFSWVPSSSWACSAQGPSPSDRPELGYWNTSLRCFVSGLLYFALCVDLQIFGSLIHQLDADDPLLGYEIPAPVVLRSHPSSTAATRWHCRGCSWERSAA